MKLRHRITRWPQLAFGVGIMDNSGKRHFYAFTILVFLHITITIGENYE